MNKKIGLVVAIIALAIVGGWMYRDKLPLDAISIGGTPVERQAWSALEQYLEYAKNHDLEGVIRLSHQINPICEDATRREECNALMDSVYGVSTELGLKASDFVNVESDEKQIIMYTNGPEVKLLYFTRAEDGSPKILGLRLCSDTPDATDTCASGNVKMTDADGDGWWDSIEELFYQVEAEQSAA